MTSRKKQPEEKDDQGMPPVIDTHYQMYGKRCPTCDNRIDEFGFCACGSSQ